MELFYILLGIGIYVGQIWGLVIVAGGHKDAPKRLRIILAIAQGLAVLALIGLSI